MCGARRVKEYILKDGPIHDFEPSDMAQSPLANAMAKNAPQTYPDGVWGSKTYTKDDGTIFGGAEWLIPGVERTRAPGKTRRFSELMHLSDYACSYDPEDYVPKQRVNITKMIMVTRGLCGSSCSLFANHAAIFDHVMTVAIGGLYGQDMQFTSFPGGQVLDTPYIQQEAGSYGVDPSLVPGPLPNDGHYRMAVREVYPHRYAHIPTEYTFMRADYRLSDTVETLLYPELSWLAVADLF